MSTVQKWKDRVQEVEDELRNQQEEIQAFAEQKDFLLQETDKFHSIAKKEKEKLLRTLQKLQDRGNTIEEKKASAAKKKEAAAVADAAATKEYAELSKTVKQLLNDEHAMANGEDYAAILQQESEDWKKEEHALRTSIVDLETQLHQNRKRMKDLVDKKCVEAKEAEKSLKAARMGRTSNEGKEPLTLSKLLARESGLFQRPGNVPTNRKKSVRINDEE